MVNFNSTYYGGGVAEILSSLSLLMSSVGIKTGWRIIQGAADFLPYRFQRNLGEIDFSTVIVFVLGGMAGILGGTALAEKLPGQRLPKLFAGFVMIVGIFLIYMNA